MTKKEYKKLRKCFNKVVRVDDISKPEYQEKIRKGGILCENDEEVIGAKKVQEFLLSIEGVFNKIPFNDAKGFIEQILFTYWLKGRGGDSGKE